MAHIQGTQFSQSEIANLAYLNWQKEGCPPGRALEYWLEAESQLKATWHLLAGENHLPESKPSGGLKQGISRPKPARKASARRETARKI